jgi:uracil-DNA glycosylase
LPDARKSLPKLREEWSSCTKCALGERRIANEGQFVFGEGVTRGVMFVGEGPGKDEEISGRPFIGKSGQILRRIIEKLNLTEYYVTNIVACRSCTPFTDGAGQPMMRKNWSTKQMEVSYKDEPPTPPQIEACAPRLYEQIYLVDPVVIVALGASAAKMLMQRHVSITSPDTRGQPFHISIPGAGYSTVRTEKRGAWIRSTGGKLHLPIEQSEVRYLCIPTIHPAFVARKLADVSGDSPFRQLAGDIRKAVQVYERYMLEVHGCVPTSEREGPLDFSEEEIVGPD